MSRIRQGYIRELTALDTTGKGLYCTWIDETEWKAVCSWLYGENLSDKRRGVERIAAWRARGTIPFPVECTADIVDCLLKDASISSDRNSTEESCALMFAMAITRFINGVYDYGVWQGVRYRAIVDVVDKLGIPCWLVSLRHDSTHRVLPSLSVLRKGISFIYQWLWTNYWKPQYITLPVTDGIALVQQIPSSWQGCGSTKTTPSLEENKVTLSNLKEHLLLYAQQKTITKRLYKTLATYEPNEFISLLNDKLFLHPITEMDHKIIIPEKSKLTLFPTLPSSLVERWKPLLHAIGRYSSLAKTNLIHALIIASHSLNKDIEADWRHTLVGWCGVLLDISHQIITHDNLLPHIEIDISSDDDSTMRGEIQTLKLLEIVKQNPGPYSYTLIDKLLSYTSDSYITKHETFLQLTVLLTISQRICWFSDICSTLPVLYGNYRTELEEFKCKVEKEHTTNHYINETCDSSISSNKVWRKAQGIDWYNCPLGCAPGQKLTPLSLDLPDITTPSEKVELTVDSLKTQLPFKEVLATESSEKKNVEVIKSCDESRDDGIRLSSSQLESVRQEISLF